MQLLISSVSAGSYLSTKAKSSRNSGRCREGLCDLPEKQVIETNGRPVPVDTFLGTSSQELVNMHEVTCLIEDSSKPLLMHKGTERVMAYGDHI